MAALLMVALLLCGGCTQRLVQALETRGVASCVWWSMSPLGSTYGVTATGGMDVRECLKIPCPCGLRP